MCTVDWRRPRRWLARHTGSEVIFQLSFLLTQSNNWSTIFLTFPSIRGLARLPRGPLMLTLASHATSDEPLLPVTLMLTRPLNALPEPEPVISREAECPAGSSLVILLLVWKTLEMKPIFTLTEAETRFPSLTV